MFNRVNEKSRSEGSSVAAIKPKQHAGRERLKHFAEGIATANNAIEDLENRVSRLAAIIVESEVAQRALQDAVHLDGGVALAAYSSGQSKKEDAITRLVEHAKSSGEAAVAAATALPRAEASLADARSQLLSLKEQKHAELGRVLAQLADRDAQEYQRLFEALGMMHDRLAGYANVAQSNIGEIQLIMDPLKVPRFALPSLGNADADPFLRYRESELTVAESARRWSTIRSRLENDVDADISDLMMVVKR